ncbi:MAG: glycosyltransferase [Candidatus Omnitrophica bacterium]|nr:glycosyltransferase [Candidatus Omnitrophota bacterium]
MQESSYKKSSGSLNNKVPAHTGRIRKGFVMAAGRGVRFRSFSKIIPKSMLLVDGEPLIVRNARLLDAAFGLDVLYVVVGYKGDMIRNSFNSIEGLNCRLEFIEIPDGRISRGLLTGYAAIVPYLEPDELFVSVLGDEYYEGVDHVHFAEFVQSSPGFSACCGVKRYVFPDEYFNNYSVDFQEKGTVVKRLIEKPSEISSPYFGLGIIAAKRQLVELAKESLDKSSHVNFIELINALPEQGLGPILGYEFHGGYVNINTRTDVFKLMRFQRESRWNNFAIDVIIPAWNEAESIAYVVKDFLPVCRQVIVMDNNSADGTARVAREAGAVVYSEPLCGYGDAIKKGLDRSNADIFIVTEADGTFRGEDAEKLLLYLKNADAVIGTRTYWQYVEYGANMPFFQRFGNMLFGTVITLLWWNRRSRFTDVGCTFRCIWRESYQKIADRLAGKGPEFSPEMIIELLNTWQRVIEIPVPYHARIMGQSKFSNGFIPSAKTALRMLSLIIFKRWKGWMENFKAMRRLYFSFKTEED